VEHRQKNILSPVNFTPSRTANALILKLTASNCFPFVKIARVRTRAIPIIGLIGIFLGSLRVITLVSKRK